MALFHLSFESEFLGANTDVNVIMPDKPRTETSREFYTKGKKYKVLWLLHGTFGGYDDWIRKSNIETYACEKDLIVVMPGIGNSDYSNWDNFTLGYDSDRFIADELMPLIQGWFPASDKREDNYIAGLSMGGKGTLTFALKYPEKFAKAAVLSYIPSDIELKREEYQKLYNMNPEEVYAMQDIMHSSQRQYNVMHKYPDFDSYMNSYYNNWKKLKEADPKKLPELFFSVGTEDPLFTMEQLETFKAYLNELHIPAVFMTGKGSHEWRVWERDIQRAFAFFGFDDETKGNAF